MENLQAYKEKVIELAMTYGLKLLLAIITLVVGLKLIALLVRLVDTIMDRHNVEVTLQRFLLSLLKILLKILLFVSVAAMVGVETTSIIALLGAAGLAVGLALQGSLANFAGGILILFFKPFKAGDVIEAQGHVGVVYEIQIFNTIIKTLDNKRVVFPNSLLSNDVITNIFVEETRRVDITFGISYDDDILHAKKVIWEVIKTDARILETPASEVYVSAHADSSINLLTRVWVQSKDYWPVYFNLYEQVKIAFDKENITIPFPQRDVHLFQESTAG